MERSSVFHGNLCPQAAQDAASEAEDLRRALRSAQGCARAADEQRQAAQDRAAALESGRQALALAAPSGDAASSEVQAASQAVKPIALVVADLSSSHEEVLTPS